MPKITVEKLTDSDMEWFVETAAVNMLVDELGRPNLVNVQNLYVLATMGALSETAFVAKSDGVPVGALGGICIPNLFNPDIQTLAEVFWYVLPEYRNTRAGAMLLNTFNNRALEVADETTMSLLPTSKVNEQTMARKGFSLREFGYLREHGRK